MRTLVAAALTTATLLCASPQSAEAQVLWRPWLRPRVMVIPPRVILPVVAPPQVYVQSYPQTYYYPPPPPPVYMQPAPPPPVYMQPAPQQPVYEQPPMVQAPMQYAPLPPPPVYVQPAPMVQAPPPAPVVVPPPPVQALPPVSNVVVQRPPVPQWRSRFGLGVRFVGAISTEDQAFSDRFTQLGFGGEVLYRASRRIVLELGGEYQKRMSNGFERYDVPVTMGMRLHIGELTADQLGDAINRQLLDEIAARRQVDDLRAGRSAEAPAEIEPRLASAQFQRVQPHPVIP